MLWSVLSPLNGIEMLRTCPVKDQEGNLEIKKTRQERDPTCSWAEVWQGPCLGAGHNPGKGAFSPLGGEGASPALKGNAAGVTDGMDVKTKMKRPQESGTLRLPRRAVGCPRKEGRSPSLQLTHSGGPWSCWETAKASQASSLCRSELWLEVPASLCCTECLGEAAAVVE